MDATRVRAILSKGNLSAEELGLMIGGTKNTVTSYLGQKSGIFSKRVIETLYMIERDLYRGKRAKKLRVPIEGAKFNIIFTEANIRFLRVVLEKGSCRGVDICKETNMSRQLVSQKAILLRENGGIFQDDEHNYTLTPIVKPLLKLLLCGTPLLTVQKICRVRESELDAAIEFLEAARQNREVAQKKGESKHSQNGSQSSTTT